MNREAAERYYLENRYPFPKEFDPRHNVECIDDRKGRTMHKIAIGGGSLGMMLDLFSVVPVLEQKHGTKIMIAHDKVVDAVDVVAGISFHSDTKNLEHPLACKGCGYCDSRLEGLHEDVVRYIAEHYLPKAMEGGVFPSIYSGSHNAHAVIILDDVRYGLPASDRNYQVYTYHRAWHDKLIEDIAERIYPDILPYVEGLTKQILRETLKEVSDEHLAKVVAHLAAGLPVYEFGKRSNLEISESGSEAEVMAE